MRCQIVAAVPDLKVAARALWRPLLVPAALYALVIYIFSVASGWHYTAVETSPFLIDVLRKKGLNVLESWTPPFPMADLIVVAG